MYVSRTSRLALRLVAASALHVLLSGPAKTIEKQWVFFGGNRSCDNWIIMGYDFKCFMVMIQVVLAIKIGLGG